MKNTLKRIMALMLSLVMMLGCVPSFVNEANAFKIEPTAEPANYQVELYYGGNKVTQVPEGTNYSDITFKLIRDDGNETLTGTCIQGALGTAGRTYVYGEVNTGKHRRANSTILDSFGNAMVDGSGSPGTYRTKTYFDQVTEEVLYCTLQLYFPIDVIATIHDYGLLADGILAGNLPATLTYKGVDTDKYTCSDDDGKWYESYNSGDHTLSTEATSITGGTTYYKKIIITPKSGYIFADPIGTTTIDDGRILYNVINDNKVEAIIEKTADSNVLSFDFPKPTTPAQFRALETSSITISGTPTPDNKDNAKTTAKISHFAAIAWYNDESDRDSIEKIYFRGKNVYTNEYKTERTQVSDFLKTHDYAWYYDFVDNNYKVAVVEKYDIFKRVEINFDDKVAGNTVKQFLDSVVVTDACNNPESGNNHMVLRTPKDDDYLDDAILGNSVVLEAGKHYVLDVWFGETLPSECYLGIYCNDYYVDNKTELTNRTVHTGYKFEQIVSPAETVLKIHYDFEVKQKPSSGGSHKKKKKTEEPKQDEPKEDPKTPEEKLEEELKKDDVKKANSNEGEKINPSAKFINGYDDGTFKAERKVNNIELMSMVTELFENVEIKESKNLNQGDNYWGQEIIDKANALGLIPGNKDNKNYNVTDEVTRGDLAVVVYNLIKDYTDSPSLNTKSNCKDAIGKNYEKAVTKLVDLGILKGYDDGLFHGDYTLTRAEAVVVINRALKSLGFEINMPSIKLSFPDLSEDHWAYVEIMYAANK